MIRGQKKRCRPSEVARPAVQAKRRRFLKHIQAIPSTVSSFWTNRLHVPMEPQHTWVKPGPIIDPVPMNGADTHAPSAQSPHRLGLVRTHVCDGQCGRFVAWLTRLLPNLRPGDVSGDDNLRAHHDSRIAPLCRARASASSICHPTRPLNPIEAGWRSRNNMFASTRPDLRELASGRPRARAIASHPHCTMVYALRATELKQVIGGINATNCADDGPRQTAALYAGAKTDQSLGESQNVHELCLSR